VASAWNCLEPAPHPQGLFALRRRGLRKCLRTGYNAAMPLVNGCAWMKKSANNPAAQLSAIAPLQTLEASARSLVNQA